MKAVSLGQSVNHCLREKSPHARPPRQKVQPQKDN